MQSDKTVSDVLHYLYANGQKELAEVVLEEYRTKRQTFTPMSPQVIHVPTPPTPCTRPHTSPLFPGVIMGGGIGNGIGTPLKGLNGTMQLCATN
jgi:hypothetical protein